MLACTAGAHASKSSPSSVLFLSQSAAVRGCAQCVLPCPPFVFSFSPTKASFSLSVRSLGALHFDPAPPPLHACRVRPWHTALAAMVLAPVVEEPSRDGMDDMTVMAALWKVDRCCEWLHIKLFFAYDLLCSSVACADAHGVVLSSVKERQMHTHRRAR